MPENKAITPDAYAKQLGKFVSDLKASLGPYATVNAPGGEDTFMNVDGEFTDPTVETDVQYLNSEGQPVDANESDLFLRGDKTWANIILGKLPTNQSEFDQLDWSEVFELNGDMSSLAEQGVTKNVQMSGDFGTQVFQLVDTNCYEKADGSGKSKMVFLSVDCLTDHTQKHADSNVSTIWSASQVKTFCDQDLYNALPADLQSAIVEVKLPCWSELYVSSSNNPPSITYVNGKVFIPSTREVFPEAVDNWNGSNWKGDYYSTNGPWEGEQYEYYQLHSEAADRIKKYQNSAKSWWLRSPLNNSGAWRFCAVYSGGGLGCYNVHATYAVAACFCL